MMKSRFRRCLAARRRRLARGCSSPTSSSPTLQGHAAPPIPIPRSRAASSGVQYKVTNADSTVSYYDYAYRTSFDVTHPGDRPARPWTSPRINLKVQQATGGIVITPSGGDQVYFKFNSSRRHEPHQREGLRRRRVRRLVRPPERGQGSPGHRRLLVRGHGQQQQAPTPARARSRWRRRIRAATASGRRPRCRLTAIGARIELSGTPRQVLLVARGARGISECDTSFRWPSDCAS